MKRLLVLLAACGTPARPPATQPASRPVDAHASADDLRAAVLDSYIQLTQGYEGVYLDGLLHDPRLVLMDVEAGDVLVGYDAQRAIAIRRLGSLDASTAEELVSKDLHVQIAEDGGSAWVDDGLSYRLLVDGRRAILPERSTAVYERREGRWIQVQGHVSYPVPRDDWFVARPATAKLATAAASGVFAEDARQLIIGVIADRTEGRQAVATDDDAVLVAPDAVLRGRDIAARPTPRALVGPSASVELIALRLDVSAAQTVAWAAALLRISDTRGEMIARATWVVVKRGGALRVVQTHLSLPVDGAELAASLFGKR
jgi:hypothetical protein